MPLDAGARAAELAALNTMLEALMTREGPPASIAQTRERYSGWGLSYPLVEGTESQPVELGGVTCRQLTPPGAARDAALLYLHGGGYALGSLDSHGHLVAQLAAAAGVTGYGVDYRLAPEHPFPAAVEDAVAAYAGLLALGLAPSRIAVAGDSAGGGLTVALALALRDRDMPLPAGLFCISPWANLTQTGAAYQAAASRDRIVSKEALDTWSALYLAGGDPAQPLASPVGGDFAGLPPLLIHVGSEEVLLSDSILLAERAGLARVPVDLLIAPDMPHVWHYMWAHLTDARAAIASAGGWIRARLGPDAPPDR